jgi:TRAP-type C4-dicarboxylate transport system permease small subunit
MAIFFFIWIVFLGFMVLFDKKRLISLDTFYAAAKGKLKTVVWYIQESIAVCLGIAMIMAFIGLYPFFQNLYFSALPKFSKIWQHYPLVVSGAFIALRALYSIIERAIGYNDAVTEKGGKE